MVPPLRACEIRSRFDHRLPYGQLLTRTHFLVAVVLQALLREAKGEHKSGTHDNARLPVASDRAKV